MTLLVEETNQTHKVNWPGGQQPPININKVKAWASGSGVTLRKNQKTMQRQTHTRGQWQQQNLRLGPWTLETR